MNETVNQDITANEPDVRTFSQEEMDAIIGDRLKRERLKYADYDELKQKAEQYDAAEEAAKSDLQKATERADALQKELDGYKRAESLRQVREKISAETGVPAKLLSGETEEACREQAEAIKAYAQPAGYPEVRDAGEHRRTISGGKTRDQFADWFSQSLT